MGLRPLSPRVGVLALQGSFEPHARAVRRLGLEPTMVRKQADLDGLSHLILPGGESTTLHHLIEMFGMGDPIRERARAGELSLFGTCAGAILIGRGDGSRPRRWGLLDASLERNAYGRQVDSFRVELDVEGLEGRPLKGTFIRAPRFTEIGPRAHVLARWRGEPVLVEGPGILAATFHPELAGDDRLHARFLGRTEPEQIVRDSPRGAAERGAAR